MNASSSSMSNVDSDIANTNRKSRLDRLGIVVPWIISFVTVWVGMWQFRIQQIQSNKQEFLKKQLELCIQATDTAARLAQSKDPVEWEKARKEFWILYWGPLAIVENDDMAKKMRTFGISLKDPVSPSDLPRRDLDEPANGIAETARDLIKTNWNVNLLPITIKHPDKD